MISQKTIQEIFETVKVEEVIEDFVNLRKRGINLIGLCPFHNEKTPSFTVSPNKNIYKCFGCGNAGNAVNFVMEHENFTYPEALRFLAQKYGIKIEEIVTNAADLAERQFQDSLYIINEYAKEQYEHNLFKTDIGKSVGLSYFKQRGFREDTIKKFGLGFAFEKKDHLTLSAVNKGYNIDLLKKVGLTSKFGRDFFRNRVMFPIHSLSGKVVGFGGRTLLKDKKIPKYINTPESDIYNKSKILYGIFHAKKSIRKEDNCIMVEGYTDVISLHQSGIENVVASSGTSLTVGQIQLVKRNTSNMTILYDGDAAGVKAALRGLDLVLEQDMNVKVVLLPEGEDPDSYATKVGSTAFKTYITEEANDFILFKTNLLLAEAKDDPIKRTELIKDIVLSIAKIPDSIKRSVYTRECSRLMEISEQILVTETNKVIQRLISKRKNAANRPTRQERNASRQSSSPKPNQTTKFDSNDSFSGLLLPPEEGGLIDPSMAGYNIPATPKTSQRNQQSTKVQGNKTFQEKDIIRVLIRFGTEIVEEEITVAQYILANMEDIIEEFDSPIYKKIILDALNNLVQNEKILSVKEYTYHTDQEIQTIAINLMTSPYDYSENWEKRFEKPLQTQPMLELNFKQDTIMSIQYFKLYKIQKVYEKNQQRLKELKPGEFDEMMIILKVQQRLGQLRTELAALSNAVVIKVV